MTPTLDDIERGVTALLAEHGLADWRFAWDNAKVRAGCCHYRARRITLSRPIYSYSAEARDDWRDTALHEIAHALTGPRPAGGAHGYEWKAVARRIGCRATRCHALPTPPRSIVARCSPGCPVNGTVSRDRFPKPGTFYKCRKCRTRLEWFRRTDLDSGVDDAGREAIAASVLAVPVVPDDKAARRSAAARKAWATRRANAVATTQQENQ